jgi:hypothetical protein
MTRHYLPPECDTPDEADAYYAAMDRADDECASLREDARADAEADWLERKSWEDVA